MEFDAQNQASRTRRCEQDCVHLSLGWRPGEKPSRADMEAAALEALAAMGMAGARAIFTAHNDTAYAHMHIVASKIDPATGRAFDLKRNFLNLSRWAEAYERSYSGGVICTRREEANELRDAVDRRDPAAVLELMTKHRATFTERDLDRTLAKQIKHLAARARFARAVLEAEDAVALSDRADGPTTRYTTRTVLEAEGHVLRAANGLLRNHRHALPEAVREATLAGPRYAGMTSEQAEAFRRATDADGLALIDGQAGTGKSFTMAAIREAYEAKGFRVVGLAPTNAVAQDMKRDGFRTAATVHAKLFALNNRRAKWDRRTVVLVDEAAMIDTKLMAMLTAHAYQAGAKLILVGDDRQLSSIDFGGMFAELRERHGAARLSQVRRQTKNDDRRATELMAEGNFHDALARYQAKGGIHWKATVDEARSALVQRWTADTAADGAKSRFVFAYTNEEVDRLNNALRGVREARGELGPGREFETKHGRFAFAAGDRLQFTGNLKLLGIFNGQAGTITDIDGTAVTVRLDAGRSISFDAEAFNEFRHGYAGTIYKGQGRTLDQTYLLHTEHWRSAASYVALSRHRDKTELFVARDVARGLKDLAWQMARIEERRAASHFYQAGERRGPVKPLTPEELAGVLTDRSLERHHRRDRVHRAFRRAADETADRAADGRKEREALKEKEKQKDKSKSKGKAKSQGGGSRGASYARLRREHAAAGARGPAPEAEKVDVVDRQRRTVRGPLLRLWKETATALTHLFQAGPTRQNRRRRNGPRL